ncbi:hypothetical protein [Corynebacterium ulcerans]|uniref:ApeA N-terminal domain 1-containing protein n=2 Tax=Corynebacterium ulcerans TaxID=65058 RepID=UPI000AECCCCD|nr:hypothetical protein [Corynebacterium ulcerans]SQG56846.1 Uncharacterised protein [Corynebacterium ulcerans]
MKSLISLALLAAVIGMRNPSDLGQISNRFGKMFSAVELFVGGYRYGRCMGSLQTTGEFWLPENPDKRIKGTLFWEPGSRARVTLKTRLIDELANPIEISTAGAVITHSGDPARIVADGVPRVLLGDTEAGPVTCVDSYLQLLPSNAFGIAALFEQTWDPYTLIVGAHMPDGNTAKLSAVRFILDSSAWWRHMPDSGSAVSGAGEVVCERTEDGLVWLEFRPSATLTLRSSDRVVHSVMTLIKLAVDVDLTPIRIQVRRQGQADWLEVKNKGQDSGMLSSPDPNNLLSPSVVTLKMLSRWLEIERSMDGLAAAVAYPVKGQAMQVQGLVACSLIEGIHKRIIDSNTKKYVERVRDLHRIAMRIDPEITDPVVEWDEIVRNVRNDLAHHNTGRSFEEQFYNWLIVESSAIWVLRLCLLSHAGFSDLEVADALGEHQRYRFYRENLKMHVKEREAELAAQDADLY